MTASNPVDQPFRRLFAGFDRDVEPPADLATRLRLRVLAEAELDDPVARRPVPAPLQAPADAPITPLRPAPPAMTPTPSLPAAGSEGHSSSYLPPPTHTDEVGARRRRQPWYLIAGEVAAVVLVLMGAAVVIIQRTIDPDRSAPRLGSSITAVAEPSGEPQLLWERTDPDLQGTGDIAAGDDLLVGLVQDVQQSGFLWFERYEYTSYLQALDRRTGEQRWLIRIDDELGFGTTYAVDDSILYASYGNEDGEGFRLVSFSAVDGSERWRTALSGQPTFGTEMAALDGVAFVSTYDGLVLAIGLATGDIRWSVNVNVSNGRDAVTPQTVAPPMPVLEGGRLFTLDARGAVVELDPTTGAVVATSPVTTPLPAQVYEGRLIVTPEKFVTVITGDQGKVGNGPYETQLLVTAIDRVTGEETWTLSTDSSATLIVGADDRIVLWTYEETFVENESPVIAASTISALDLRTGVELWSVPGPAGYINVSPSSASTADGQLLLGTQAGEVVSLDVATGTELWRYDVGDLVAMPPVVTGALAIVGDRPGHLVAIAIPENGG